MTTMTLTLTPMTMMMTPMTMMMTRERTRTEERRRAVMTVESETTSTPSPPSSELSRTSTSELLLPSRLELSDDDDKLVALTTLLATHSRFLPLLALF